MRPLAVKPVSFVRLIGFTGFKFSVQVRLKRCFQILDLAFGDEPIFDQALSIKRQRCLLLFDLFVHHRVGEHRLVAFVMTKAAVADDVENHVFVELLAELSCDARGVHDCFWVIAVDVENRGLDHERDVSRVGRRAAKVWRGCKADLVVDHDVHGAAGFVPFKAGQTEPFGHDALASKGRVAVQQDSHNFFAVFVFFLVLFGADLADDDGVHSL